MVLKCVDRTWNCHFAKLSNSYRCDTCTCNLHVRPNTRTIHPHRAPMATPRRSAATAQHYLHVDGKLIRWVCESAKSEFSLNGLALNAVWIWDCLHADLWNSVSEFKESAQTKSALGNLNFLRRFKQYK